MAQKVQIHLIDDMTGEEAQETVNFSVDGVSYEIDLTTENATELRNSLSVYTEKGRKSSGKNAGRSRGAGKASGREETQRIRKWAQENGHTPSSRGRISSEIRDAYNAAHN